ncbi:glutathione S-transferase N-terminal domain-containing protein [Actinoallomurus sp. NPDC050550]|uniref:glutathione S-transferase family protein n=1 Tax=Actinoallomurus sp. NPDC050550 TaxID=3154937 RepID=UPI0033CE2498
MRVYGSATSACTHKVLMVFAEKGHEAELVEVDVLRGQDKLPEHVARMPFGEIPVLDDDGFLLYESRAIIRYLDQRLPGPSLTPDDIRLRGLMEQWISVEQSYVSGPVWDLVRAGPVYDIIRRSPAVALFPPRRTTPASPVHAPNWRARSGCWTRPWPTGRTSPVRGSPWPRSPSCRT